MSRPAIYNWKNETRGDTIPSRKFTPTINGAAVDLSVIGICMQIRDSNGTMVKEVSKGSGIVLDGNNSFIVEDINHETKAGQHTYDIQFDFPDGTIKTWVKGTIIIEQDVTRKT